MLLYNITFSVELKSHEEWLGYMKTTFVPTVLETKLPRKSKIMRLLTELDNGAMTYSFQFFFEEMEDYMGFEMNHKEAIFDKINDLYAGKYVLFSTLLEEI